MSFLRRNNQTSNSGQILRAPKRSKWKYFFWGFILLFVGIIGWVGVTGILAYKNISSKNAGDQSSFLRFNGNVSPDQLKGEGDGRINILLIGIGGEGHPGGQLADTIQVFSVDPINKAYSLLSIPRDFYVPIPKDGSTKINAVYANGNQYCKALKLCDPKIDQGGAVLKQTVSTILDVPIHYFVRVDFNGFKKIIDTLGGIQVYVDKPLNDPFFPDEKLQGYAPLYIPAGLQTFDGTKALKYARSRETTSDFDRARRQQQILAAVKQKMLSASVYSNPKKITDIISILGSHLRTDLQSGEITKLFSLVGELDDTKTITKVLDTSPDSPLKSLNDPRAGYIIVPKLGLGKFDEVQEFAETVFLDPYLAKEKSRISVIDASGKKTADKVVKKLKSLGYNVVSTTTATASTSASSIKYKTDNNPYTLSLIKRRLNLTPSKTSSLDTSISDLVITIGSSYTFN